MSNVLTATETCWSGLQMEAIAFAMKNRAVLGLDGKQWAVSGIVGREVTFAEIVPVKVEAPSGWTGEGLPPMGALVLAHEGSSEQYRVFAFDGEYVAIASEYTRVWRHASQVYPIRTPEQIAAEDRDKAIAEMVLACPYPGSDSTRIDCAALYDAGYRKHDAQQLQELQASSDIHQANRELAEQRLRRLAEIDGKMACGQESVTEMFNLEQERREILSHYREQQA